jgi:hypothetical protein
MLWWYHRQSELEVEWKAGLVQEETALRVCVVFAARIGRDVPNLLEALIVSQCAAIIGEVF